MKPILKVKNGKNQIKFLILVKDQSFFNVIKKYSIEELFLWAKRIPSLFSEKMKYFNGQNKFKYLTGTKIIW